jgi:hypothetical protein
MTTREQAISALQALVAGAYAWTTAPSRRLKLWTDVPLSQRPACFLFEGGRNAYGWSNVNAPKRDLDVQLFIYIDAKDPNVIGSTQLNNINDALDAALAPDSGYPGAPGGANTLGGLVASCRIFGEVLKEPGDLDGDGMLLVPIKIILP